jgi:hypothetical protein
MAKKVGGGKVAAAKTVKKPQKAQKPMLAVVGNDIKQDSRATMFEAPAHSKLVHEAGVADFDDGAFKSIRLRCIGCEGSFDEKVGLTPVEYRVKCPHCSRIHILVLKPANDTFTVFSETADLAPPEG